MVLFLLLLIFILLQNKNEGQHFQFQFQNLKLLKTVYHHLPLIIRLYKISVIYRKICTEKNSDEDEVLIDRIVP